MNPSEYEVHTDIQLRFRDLDAMGHVNNSVYLTFLELGRLAYHRALGGELAPDKFRFILARIELDYLFPILLNDRVTCRVKVSELSRSSFRYSSLLPHSDEGLVFA